MNSRALQQFFKWYCDRDPAERVANPMAWNAPAQGGSEGGRRGPTAPEVAALMAACTGTGSEARRDFAILCLFR